jgi:CheY-like chemotaxis protein
MSKKILVIDDEPAQLRLVQSILGNQGFQVFTAESGQESLRMVFEHKPDVVLLDVMMPGIDGWQTCSCIREL